MRFPRERRILAATAVLAVGVPVGAAAWVGDRTAALADHLGAAGGVPASIGTIDADLTGTIRLTDVAVGRLVAADAIEASVALDSLLDGQLGADEIRVAAPRVALQIDRTGDSDLARLIRRLARTGHGAAAGGEHRMRRIVVGSGTLTAHVDGIGDLSADGVELVPDAGGVRVITGKLTLRGGDERIHGELAFARGAAELALPHARFGRVLAVGGTGSLVASDHTLALRDVAVGRLSPGGVLELHAALDEAGVPRAFGVEVSPKDLAITLRGDHLPLAAIASLAPHGIDVTSARASGELTIRRLATAAGGAIQLAVAGSLDGLRLDHRSIAAHPVELDAALRGTVAISGDAIAVDRLAIDVGAAHVTATGWLRRGSPVSGQVEIKLADAACGDLLRSVPAEIRGPLDGMAMAGSLGGRARLSLDLAAPPGDGVELDTALDNHCEVTAEPPAADVTTLAGPSEQTFPDGTRARVGKDTPQWFPLHRLPWYASRAFVSAEDGLFFEHHGFDLRQIARSLEIDLRDHKLARGGSTISQQLVKNSFLTLRRSLDRKLQEAILTWRLESRLDKATILERYLNVIELGPHVFGLRAAAQYWFNESPHELTIRQSAFLAALTAEPSTMSRRVRHAGGLDPDSAARVDVVLRAMLRDGVLDKGELDTARDAPMHFAAAALKTPD